MAHTNFSLAAFSPELEQAGDFHQLLVLGDRDEGTDLLAASLPNESKRHWLGILASAESFAKRCDDGRLELLRYRATLQLKGIRSAFGLIVSWCDGFDSLDNLPDTLDDVARKDIFFQLCYFFFSSTHLKELRAASLDENFELKAGEILQLLQPAVGAKQDPSLQRLRNDLIACTAAGTDVISLVNRAQSFFGALERWLVQNNDFSVEVNANPLKKWLSRLREVLSQHSVSSSGPETVTNSIGDEVEEQQTSSSSSRQNNVRQRLRSMFSALTEHPPDKVMDSSRISFENLRRDDVIFILKNICKWYEIHEPGSPAPYFIQRALRAMNVDFMTILQDLLPEVVPQFEKLAGVTERK